MEWAALDGPACLRPEWPISTWMVVSREVLTSAPLLMPWRLA